MPNNCKLIQAACARHRLQAHTVLWIHLGLKIEQLFWNPKTEFEKRLHIYKEWRLIFVSRQIQHRNFRIADDHCYLTFKSIKCNPCFVEPAIIIRPLIYQRTGIHFGSPAEYFYAIVRLVFIPNTSHRLPFLAISSILPNRLAWTLRCKQILFYW